VLAFFHALAPRMVVIPTMVFTVVVTLTRPTIVITFTRLIDATGCE
jgi:hypothetical protein